MTLKNNATQPRAKSRPRAGRPTREEAERRHEELLNCALDIFLERGYEQATTLDIANALGMSKRTVYAYYKDKETLFKAAVQRSIQRYTVPIESLRALETDDLATTLIAVARLRITNVSTPEGIRLQRILTSQAYRFPELLRSLFLVATRPTVQFLSELFEQLNQEGKTSITNTQRAAVSFLTLVVSGPVRAITAGERPSDAELEEQILFSVQLFLHGVLPR